MEIFSYVPPADPEASEEVRPRHEQSLVRKINYSREYGNAVGAALGHGDVTAMVTTGERHTIGFHQEPAGGGGWRGLITSELSDLTEIRSQLATTDASNRYV